MIGLVDLLISGCIFLFGMAIGWFGGWIGGRSEALVGTHADRVLDELIERYQRANR